MTTGKTSWTMPILFQGIEMRNSPNKLELSTTDFSIQVEQY